VGYVFAYALTRTAIPFKGFFKAIATIPVISPPFVLSLSMIFLFGRNGLITKKLLGIEDSNVYGLHSLIVVQSISFFPIAYLTLTGILEKLNPAVEDAALNLGASRARIFRTVTLPLSLPGIVSAILLVFIQSLEDFSNPAVISGNFPRFVEAYRTITACTTCARRTYGPDAPCPTLWPSPPRNTGFQENLRDGDGQAHRLAQAQYRSQDGLAAFRLLFAGGICRHPFSTAPSWRAPS